MGSRTENKEKSHTKVKQFNSYASSTDDKLTLPQGVGLVEFIHIQRVIVHGGVMDIRVTSEGEITSHDDTSRNVGGETHITMLLPSCGSRRAQAILWHLAFIATGVVALVPILLLCSQVVIDTRERSLRAGYHPVWVWRCDALLGCDSQSA